MEDKKIWELKLGRLTVEVWRVKGRYEIKAPRPLSAEQLREVGHLLLRVWAEERKN